MTALIVCNGSISDYTYYGKYFKTAKLIICVDGGASHMRRFGVRPDILVGDFDSISKEDYDYYCNQGVEIVRLPVEKDMTDTEVAADLAVERGCNTIIFIGCLGCRFDHSISNVFMLKKLLDKGISGFIVNEHNEITLIRDKMTLKREDNTKVTLLPFAQRVEGVNLKGFYYPLNDATIEIGSTWGVSNEFTADTAEISVRNGELLVIKARD